MEVPPSTDRLLSSSLRTRTAEESLALVEPLALSRGITRVVDTTWLDRIGIPVYASVRPSAQRETLAVHAGKGFTHSEAKIGAYMEALEFSFAGQGHNRVDYQMVKPMDIVNSFRGGLEFVDFAPSVGRRISETDDIAAVEGEEILAGKGLVLVPAELAYHLFLENPGVHLYGTGTNGLSSGNTLMEATVHGICEVMERHVNSFQYVKDETVLVDTANASPKVREMVRRVEAAGLRCHLRYAANEFGLPHFNAFVLEPDERAPISVAGGHGFHPNREIAAVRAVAEAVQSRLTHIHGGRDDIIDHHRWAQAIGEDSQLACTRLCRAAAADNRRVIAFEATPSAEVRSVREALATLFKALTRVGLHHVVRVQFTDDDYPFQVVKVVIPGAEMYERQAKRVGPRLMKLVTDLKQQRLHAA